MSLTTTHRLMQATQPVVPQPTGSKVQIGRGNLVTS